jgi:hypothetical protein
MNMYLVLEVAVSIENTRRITPGTPGAGVFSDAFPVITVPKMMSTALKWSRKTRLAILYNLR